jgi:AraC family transcriptional regulator of adaptative response/methylated-DNA-[protein]-cysteine methyltransferase
VSQVAKEGRCDRIRELCELIATQTDQPLSLERLAKQAGVSPFHLQRTFKAALGVSPREYHDALRLRTLKQGLRTDANVAAAIYGAGFGSSSRVYERTDVALGMTPREYRRGGAGLSISYATGATLLGRILVAATDRGICCIEFARSDAALERLLAAEFPDATCQPMVASQQPQFAVWLDSLNQWLRGRSLALDLPLELRGTAFQCAVWRYLQTIPAGETRSYAEVARGLGRPAAARAVARACASNRIAVAVPCHRVIRGSGELGGYRWGRERKRRLLAVEGRASQAAIVAGSERARPLT